MKIDILTLFPEMFSPLKTSILKRAQDNNILEINLINFRDFSEDKHHKVDDTPYGGGEGMVLTCQPIFSAIKSLDYKNAKMIYMSPKGKVLNHNLCKEYSKFEHIIILCGHYEGVDQRVLDYFQFQELSIGDFVLTGGEIPAMAFIDAISRFIPKVLNNENSANEESFANGLLEYPQYTKPYDYFGLKVPDVLISGNHAEIKKYRLQESLRLTKIMRPELLGDNNEN